MDIGERMLVCGTEVGKVEDAISRICRSYGAARVDVLSITSSIITTIETPEGDSITQTRRIENRTNDLAKIEALNRLSRKICAEKPAVSEIQEELQKIDSMKPMRWYFAALAAIVVAASFTMFFGGSVLDSLAAALVGIVVFTLERYAVRLKSNKIVFNLLVSIVAGALCIVCWKLGLGQNLDLIMIGVIMLLIPGMAFTGAIEDLLVGDTITGVLRLCEALIAACAIAAGFALSTYVLDADYVISTPDGENWWLPLIMAFVAAAAFGMKLGMKRPLRLLTAGIGGFIGWGAYLLAALILNDFFSCLIAATVGAIYAQIMARVMRAPAAVFLIPAVIPLVPGRALYYTISSAMHAEPELMSQWGTTAALEALAIALGMVLVILAVGAIKSISRKIKNRKKA